MSDLPIFYMMVGLPYSGKSTYAQNIPDATLHSSDEIRAELFGDIGNQIHNDRVFDLLHLRVKQDLLAGKNTVFDATNLNYKRRMNTLQHLSKVPCKKVCVFMATPFPEIMERAKHRDRVVPNDVLTRMYKSVWIPNYYEGWDDIQLVYPSSFHMWNIDVYMELIRLMPHDNPHHTLSIGGHCMMTRDLIKNEAGYSRYLELAALLHDIGKPFTKSFYNSKGELTHIAHYYEHHHVSAYNSLFYLPEDADRLHIASVIQWHMRPFEFAKAEDPERATNRFKELVGDRVFHDVMALHRADVAAH